MFKNKILEAFFFLREILFKITFVMMEEKVSHLPQLL